jgi:hypothetical protein
VTGVAQRTALASRSGGPAGTASSSRLIQGGIGMAFVQIMEFRTSDIDAVRKIDEEWRRATEGKRTVRRVLVTRDRSEPDRYFTMVFFDSYESAMENSALPETKFLADQLTKTTSGPPAFHDLDVLEDWA